MRGVYGGRRGSFRRFDETGRELFRFGEGEEEGERGTWMHGDGLWLTSNPSSNVFIELQYWIHKWLVPQSPTEGLCNEQNG